jgi:hypothetical protein
VEIMPTAGRLPQDRAAWKIAGHRSASGVAALRADMVIKKGHGESPVPCRVALEAFDVERRRL